MGRSADNSALLVCIKTPHPRFARDRSYLDAFETEAHHASLLEHPHIVTLQEIGTDDDGRPYLVFAFIEGVDLGELLAGVRGRGQQLSWAVVAVIAAQLTQALEHAHKDYRGPGNARERPPVIHRDICPANILIGTSGVSYLTDFGIALALEEASLVPSLEGTGRIAYCAPERLTAGRTYDARADLFSLGVVLFEALTGHKPFPVDSIAAHIARVFSGERPRIEALRAEFLPGFHGTPPRGLIQLVAIVHRMIEPDPENRYASTPDLADALAQIVIPAGAHRELTKAAEDQLPPWRRQLRLRTEETPAVVHPKPRTLWGSTDPSHLTPYLKGSTFDPERDGIRISSAGAQRLLADRTAHPFADTKQLDRSMIAPSAPGGSSAPAVEDFVETMRMGSGAPFDSTVPDRPVIRIEDAESSILTPPPMLELPVFPVSNDQGTLDLAYASSGSTGSTASPANTSPPSAPRHARALGLPALRVNTAGDLAAVVPGSNAQPPTPRPRPPGQPPNTEPPPARSSRSRWVAAALLLSALGICGIGALATLGWVASALGTVTNNDGSSRPSYGGLDLGPEPIFYSHVRPILADIDGDGIQDMIGSGSTTDRLLIAASGAGAETLWTYALPADSINHTEQGFTFAAPSQQLVLHIDHAGNAYGIDGRTGDERWRAELGGPLQTGQPLPCVTTDAAYVRSAQDFWTAIDLESGAHRDAGPPDGECDPQRPLGFRSRGEHRDNDSTGWEPNDHRAHLNDDGSWRRGWLLPEQPRLLVEGSASASGRTVAVLALFETHIGRRGRPRPADAPLWQTFVAADPTVTVTDGTRNITGHGNHVFVVYDMVRSRADSAERVAAFDLRTGARLWDTALERNTGRVAFIEADADRVWVGHQALEILDRRTGHHLGRVGRW